CFSDAQMRGRADRQKFGQSLNNSQNDRKKIYVQKASGMSKGRVRYACSRSQIKDERLYSMIKPCSGVLITNELGAPPSRTLLSVKVGYHKSKSTRCYDGLADAKSRAHSGASLRLF